ncbi:MAG: thioredoxin-disulfide reductase [Bifidobacterium sp.]|uniref:Thioredoxin reductase n=1 Tax=Bifidobacterium fermentum TaxID=3059035 RepID=A0AB39UN21_9BIFI
MTQEAEKTDQRDVVIIGSGPAGYTAALYLARAGYQPVVLAGALTPGGQLVNTTEVENYPGFPDGILGPDLMDKMHDQAEKFGAQIEYDDVVSVDFQADDGLKHVTTDSGTTYSTRAVVVTTGAQYKKLGVPGEVEYSGRGVSYCATCDGFFFKGKPIVVIGGGDSAMEEADFLAGYGSSVTLIHRRNEFRASTIMADRVLSNDNINVIYDSIVTAVHGDDKGAQSVDLTNVVSGETSSLQASGVFVAIGSTPETAFLNGSLETDEDGYITVEHDCTRTSIPGVFAAGDVVDKVYRQAVSAAGMGCRAALDAQSYLSSISQHDSVTV